MAEKMKVEVVGPDAECDVWLDLQRDGKHSSINLGPPDEPIAAAALDAAGDRAAGRHCSPPAAGQPSDIPADLSEISDEKLILLYDSTPEDSPQVDRIANEMGERGIDI